MIETIKFSLDTFKNQYIKSIINLINFAKKEFHWKVLGIQIFLTIYILVHIDFFYIQASESTIELIHNIINYSLGTLGLITHIRIIGSGIGHFKSMIYNKGSVKVYWQKERLYYYSYISGLLQISISWFVVSAAFGFIEILDFTLIKNTPWQEYIALIILVITMLYGYINIILGFFSIQSRPYRINYLVGPFILLGLISIYFMIP